MDALAHNLEAFCAPGFHPMADGIALEGMRLIKNSLIEVYNIVSKLDDVSVFNILLPSVSAS